MHHCMHLASLLVILMAIKYHTNLLFTVSNDLAAMPVDLSLNDNAMENSAHNPSYI